MVGLKDIFCEAKTKKKFFCNLDPARKAFDIQEGSLLSSPKSLFLFREWYYTIPLPLPLCARLTSRSSMFTHLPGPTRKGPEDPRWHITRNTIPFILSTLLWSQLIYFLEDYFRGKVPRSINLTNYEFSWWIFLQYGSRKMEPPESHQVTSSSHRITSHCVT